MGFLWGQGRFPLSHIYLTHLPFITQVDTFVITHVLNGLSQEYKDILTTICAYNKVFLSKSYMKLVSYVDFLKHTCPFQMITPCSLRLIVSIYLNLIPKVLLIKTMVIILIMIMAILHNIALHKPNKILPPIR